jgi:hypothetical protein
MGMVGRSNSYIRASILTKQFFVYMLNVTFMIVNRIIILLYNNKI